MSRLEQFEKAHGKGDPEAAKAYREAGEKKTAAFKEAVKDEIAPMSWIDRKKGEIVISEDEWPGKAKEGPLSPNADGAAVTLVISEEALAAKKLTPAAELLGFAAYGSDPEKPNEAAVAAAKKLLARKGLKAENIALFEILENSAEDVAGIAADLKISAEKINPFGGALAFGRCDGAEGILMLQRLIKGLQLGEAGLLMIPSPGGMGMAALLKKC